MRTIRTGKYMEPVWPFGQTFKCHRCECEFAPDVSDKPDGIDAQPVPGTGIQTGNTIQGATFRITAVYGCPNCGEPVPLVGEMRQGDDFVRTLGAGDVAGTRTNRNPLA